MRASALLRAGVFPRREPRPACRAWLAAWAVAIVAAAAVPAQPARAQPAQSQPARAQPSQSQPARSQPAHRYRLRARLDARRHRVHGRARIRWTNESQVPARALLFHLYLNAFEDEGTVFMRESKGQLRGVAFEGRGRIELETLRLAGGADLLRDAEEELVPGDRTQLRARLPEAVEPGRSIEIESTFTAHLPPLFARSGYQDDFHMVAQWFPKLARREPDGTWASFPYHGHGEFYAPFARYELQVDVPAGYRIGATGERVSRHENGSRTVHRFVAAPVHDAAFAAWPHFVEHRTAAEGVDVRLLAPPGFETAVREHLAVVRAGLRFFGAAYGAYPYDSLTVIVPPRGAAGAAGMEYPTLFVTGGPWLAVPGVRAGMGAHITAHELAHQWFQGLVASHEVRHPMLDEGLTTWSTWELLGRMYGRRGAALDLLGVRIDPFEGMRAYAVRNGGRLPPPSTPASRFRGAAYGRSVYGRTATVLETVARSFGRHGTLRALGTYARRHRFGHPTPQDLYRAFDERFGETFSDRILRPALEDGVRAPLVAHALAPHGTAVATRKGLPVPVEVEAVGPPAKRRVWAGDDPRFRWTGGRIRTGRGLRIDPDSRVLLDPSVLDNGVRDGTAPGTFFGALVATAQSVLAWLGP